MKINTHKPLVDADGRTIMDGYTDADNAQQTRSLTIGLALSGALFLYQGEDPQKGVSPATASDCYCLAMKLRNQDEVAMKSEDVALAKKAIVKQYAPLVSGQVISILEGEEEGESEAE